MRARYILAIASLAILFFAGVPQDGIHAITGTHKGDRLRYFKYLQCARSEGVPAALNKYGVRP